MTRPRKQTVDYFPHSCKHGKTMFILEQQYGNDGYAFWFKTLEILGETEGHCLFCNDLPSWKYLLSRTHLEAEKVEEILNLLADLGAIDVDLWKLDRKIWSDHFIENLSFAYRNREVVIPNKPDIECKKSGICRDMPDNQCKKSANEMKVNEMKVNENPPTPQRGRRAVYSEEFEKFWDAYPRKVGKAAAYKSWQNQKRAGVLPGNGRVLEAITEQSNSDQWRKDGGQYIPNPSTWLNQARWDDKLQTSGETRAW